MPNLARRPGTRALAPATALAASLLFALSASGPASAATVYKWVDANGITHLSQSKPPAGVAFERFSVGSLKTPGTAKSGAGSASKGNVRLASATPEQSARRNAVIEELQTRECVVALEAMDRLARSGKPVDPDEFKRLQQTSDRNCSQDPATRRQQEEMAAKYRVARSDECIQARNQLAEMLEPGRKPPTREQLKSQQLFIERHCESPVR
jgi:hypothetical protein